MQEEKGSFKKMSKELGISPSTVSRVLNHPELVKKSTREIVYSYMEKSDSNIRLSTTTQKQIIGLTFSDPNSLFISSVIPAIVEHLSNTKYQLLLFDLEKRRDVYEYFSQHIEYLKKIDALIIATSTLSKQGSNYFKKMGIPLVLFHTFCPDELCIMTNNYKGGQDCANYLLSRGYQKIAFVGWTPDDEHIQERFNGFSSVYPIKKEFHILTNLSSTGGYNATAKLMNLSEKPDAIFYGSDSMAAGGIRYLRENNINVNKDIGVMGFDDLPIAELMGITTMSQFINTEISLAVDYLLKRLANPNEEQGHDEISITPKLVVRTSTK